MPHPDGIILAPTATKLAPDTPGSVVVSASHGGAYAGYLIARAGARALVLNDAGVGLDEAGIGSLSYCERFGMAAATVSHDSARIGDAEDMLAHGIISHANRIARAAGCEPGMRCEDAARALRGAPAPTDEAPGYAEARHELGRTASGLRIICIDSVSLVEPEDAGHVVVSGSHGGLVAGQRALAIRVDAAAALYNDAGLGKDEAGASRLPALDERRIAGAVVAAATARIGDGRSTYEDGVLSRVNDTAAALGMEPGMPAREAVERVRA